MLTKLPPFKCPKCLYSLEENTAIDGQGAKPTKGDVSICFNCGQILTFAEDLRLVLPTEEQLKAISDSEDSASLMVVKSYIMRRGPLHEPIEELVLTSTRTKKGNA